MPNLYKYKINYTGSSKVIRRIVDRLNNITIAILGTAHDEAFYGDWGNEAYQHSLLREGNPHNVTLNDLGIEMLPRQIEMIAEAVGSVDYWVTHEDENVIFEDHEGNLFIFSTGSNLLAWH